MGDGTIPQNRRNGLPSMKIAMTNRNFLEWLDKQLGIMSCGVRLSASAEYKMRKSGFSKENLSDEPNFNDVFLLTTRCSNQLKYLDRWYNSGKKTFPKDIELTPIKLKMWFVTDGSYGVYDNYEQLRITCTNEKNNKNKILNYFDELPFGVYWSDDKNIAVKDKRGFYKYIGNPPPGFGYKWPDELFYDSG